MNTALVSADFSPFTKRDLSILKQLHRKYRRIGILLENADEHKRKIVELSIRPFRYLFLADKNTKGEKVECRELGRGLSYPDFRELTNKAAEYCLDKVLYVDKIARKELSQDRYEHVKAVAMLSARLAEHYGIGYNRGLLAGYLHDITKEWDKKKQKEFTLAFFPEQEKNSPKIYHQFSAEIVAGHMFQIRDRRILDAIGHHTTGDDRKTLSRIVYCADKCDDTREFNYRDYMQELCFRNLEEAFAFIYGEQRKHIEESIHE